MRLIFMGTPDFAVPALEALVAAGHGIAAVYTRAPRPAGRGQAERPSPVHARAAALGLPVRTPATLRDPDAQAAFAALGADAAVVVAYGLILPQPVLDAPRHGCLNIHASLLPRWRGAAPIQRAIMAGDAATGISIMRMEAGLDTGPVALTESVPIGPGDTAGDLHDRLARLGARLVVEALARLPDLAFVPQPEAGATYAAKIDKAEARVDWTRPAPEVDRQIRGLSPFPGAWTVIGGERVKLLASRLADGQGAPGEVLDAAPTVACGTGAVRLMRLQRAGRAPQEAEAFLRGFALGPGDRLADGRQEGPGDGPQGGPGDGPGDGRGG
ncbi:MAG: methionyl-tRNA formyltransferase [Rhodobacteraceae bacterium]|nr:methionyl-tRNA formyltransferase [Paracoccaceae bacterium]